MGNNSFVLRLWNVVRRHGEFSSPFVSVYGGGGGALDGGLESYIARQRISQQLLTETSRKKSLRGAFLFLKRVYFGLKSIKIVLEFFPNIPEFLYQICGNFRLDLASVLKPSTQQQHFQFHILQSV